eukprot:4737764-Pyramimonas_sp.AAC.1
MLKGWSWAAALHKPRIKSIADSRAGAPRRPPPLPAGAQANLGSTATSPNVVRAGYGSRVRGSISPSSRAGSLDLKKKREAFGAKVAAWLAQPSAPSNTQLPGLPLYVVSLRAL